MKMAITDRDHFVYGRCPNPVECGHGLTIGGGSVVPEINFTLPPMEIAESTWPEVRRQYSEMIGSVLERAIQLEVPQLLVEFETLPGMTHRPAWGLEIVRLLADALARAHTEHGLKCALRFTPNDIRESSRPPLMRRGEHWEAMNEIFSGAGHAGADMISIESTGGKEIHDKALLHADLKGIVYALGVLAYRDMAFLWSHLVGECKRQSILPAGDTACGFANTAMVLADRGMIPRSLAAIVRVATVPRSLVAYLEGATGPSKDCAYEGPYLKAMAGIPISMEGKSCACAHLSPVGNVAQAVCDAWSNESVQNIQLLSGKAPVVSMEHLAYDCRLMNTASAEDGGALRLSRWLAESDAPLDVQAYVLHPEVVLRLCERIVEGVTPYEQTIIAVQESIEEMIRAVDDNAVQLPEREVDWLNRLRVAAAALPAKEEAMIDQMIEAGSYADVYRPSEYGLQGA